MFAEQAYFTQFSGFNPDDSRADISAIANDLYRQGYDDFIYSDDEAITKGCDCDACGSRNTYGRGFSKLLRDGYWQRSYKVFAVCDDCGHVMEL